MLGWQLRSYRFVNIAFVVFFNHGMYFSRVYLSDILIKLSLF